MLPRRRLHGGDQHQTQDSVRTSGSEASMCAPIEVSAPTAEWPHHELESFGGDNGRAVFRNPWTARMERRTRQHPALPDQRVRQIGHSATSGLSSCAQFWCITAGGR